MKKIEDKDMLAFLVFLVFLPVPFVGMVLTAIVSGAIHAAEEFVHGVYIISWDIKDRWDQL